MLGISKFASFIFLDLETTGLQQPIEITELSMIAVERKHVLESTKTKVLPRILDKFTSCVQPAKNIECLASSMTGLSNEDLENKKSFDIEFGEMVRSFILRQPQPVCLIAHNGDNFDFKILFLHLQTVGVKLPDSIACSDSLKAFRKQHQQHKDYPNFPNGAAISVVPMLGEIQNAHSAEGDALVLLKLVLHKPDILEYLESGAYRLFCLSQANDKNSSKKEKKALDAETVNQVQDEYLSQLEKEEI
ncbi:Three prime repair exonuclease 2 [Acropora cervicornis]|uniref:Three prime repair exonuclease 2 n=1 Tax=Acropora cervicornis TaxID=6130 RepID=A0AAD9R615_ACRCE|nr:Three prime repair exonuclease 2 [Acropora cervicornis]